RHLPAPQQVLRVRRPRHRRGRQRLGSGLGTGLQVRVDDLSGREVALLLQEHLRGMRASSPPESVHALDLDALRQPEITFWTACGAGAPAGCGALKQLAARHGEIKSMRTASAHLRQGVASRLVETILAEAARRSYRRLSLETGSGPAFEPALRLYT